MANAPWARLTNPIRPIVTDSPTETINSTVPAANPPNKMLATSIPAITKGPAGRQMLRGRPVRGRSGLDHEKLSTGLHHFLGAHGPMACALHSSFTRSI